jgi:hypothetical protein
MPNNYIVDVSELTALIADYHKLKTSLTTPIHTHGGVPAAVIPHGNARQITHNTYHFKLTDHRWKPFGAHAMQLKLNYTVDGGHPAKFAHQPNIQITYEEAPASAKLHHPYVLKGDHRTGCTLVVATTLKTWKKSWDSHIKIHVVISGT